MGGVNDMMSDIQQQQQQQQPATSVPRAPSARGTGSRGSSGRSMMSSGSGNTHERELLTPSPPSSRPSTTNASRPRSHGGEQEHDAAARHHSSRPQSRELVNRIVISTRPISSSHASSRLPSHSTESISDDVVRASDMRIHGASVVLPPRPPATRRMSAPRGRTKRATRPQSSGSTLPVGASAAANESADIVQAVEPAAVGELPWDSSKSTTTILPSPTSSFMGAMFIADAARSDLSVGAKHAIRDKHIHDDDDEGVRRSRMIYASSTICADEQDSRMDEKQKLSFEEVMSSHDATRSEQKENASDSIPYHEQGDPSLYHPTLLMHRQGLFYHPRICKWIRRFWKTFACVPNPSISTATPKQGFMTYKEYESVHLRISKALYPKWDRGDAEELCKMDWRRDSRALPVVSATDSLGVSSSALLSYAHFARGLFELVDLWTLSVDLEEYVDFLAILYARITHIEEREIEPPTQMQIQPNTNANTGSHDEPKDRPDSSMQDRQQSLTESRELAVQRRSMEMQRAEEHRLGQRQGSASTEAERPHSQRNNGTGEVEATSVPLSADADKASNIDIVGPGSPGGSDVITLAAAGFAPRYRYRPQTQTTAHKHPGYMRMDATPATNEGEGENENDENSNADAHHPQHNAADLDEMDVTDSNDETDDVDSWSGDLSQTQSDENDAGTNRVLPIIDHSKRFLSLAIPDVDEPYDTEWIPQTWTPSAFAVASPRAGIEKKPSMHEQATPRHTQRASMALSPADKDMTMGAPSITRKSVIVAEVQPVTDGSNSTVETTADVVESAPIHATCHSIDAPPSESPPPFHASPAPPPPLVSASVTIPTPTPTEAQTPTVPHLAGETASQEQASRQPEMAPSHTHDNDPTEKHLHTHTHIHTQHMREPAAPSRAVHSTIPSTKTTSITMRTEKRSKRRKEIAVARQGRARVLQAAMSSARGDAGLRKDWKHSVLSPMHQLPPPSSIPMRRSQLDHVIAERRQRRIQRALEAAQKRLADLQATEVARQQEQQEKMERQMEFFRALDESIAKSDPSYVPPELYADSSASMSRHSERRLATPELLELDSMRVPYLCLADQKRYDDLIASGDIVESSTTAKMEGDSSSPRQRLRSAKRLHAHGSVLAGRTLSEEIRLTPRELAKVRNEKRRVENKKRMLNEKRRREMEQGIGIWYMDDAANTSEDAENDDDADDSELELDVLLDGSIVTPAPLDSIDAVPDLAQPSLSDLSHDASSPTNSSAAMSRLSGSPELEAHLQSEIKSLQRLDAKLRKTFGSRQRRRDGGTDSNEHEEEAAMEDRLFRPWDKQSWMLAESITSPHTGKIGRRHASDGTVFLSPSARAQHEKHRLADDARRLKFLRRKVSLAKRIRVGAVASAEDKRELKQLETKLVGMVDEAGNIIDADGTIAMRTEGQPVFHSPSFDIAAAPASKISFSSSSLSSHGQSTSGLWAVRQRMSRRRVLKYSAAAILAEEAEGPGPWSVTGNDDQNDDGDDDGLLNASAVSRHIASTGHIMPNSVIGYQKKEKKQRLHARGGKQQKQNERSHPDAMDAQAKDTLRTDAHADADGATPTVKGAAKVESHEETRGQNGTASDFLLASFNDDMRDHDSPSPSEPADAEKREANHEQQRANATSRQTSDAHSPSSQHAPVEQLLHELAQDLLAEHAEEDRAERERERQQKVTYQMTSVLQPADITASRSRRQLLMHDLVPHPFHHMYTRMYSTYEASNGTPPRNGPRSRPVSDISSPSPTVAIRLQLSRADLLPTSAALPLGAGTLKPVGISFASSSSSSSSSTPTQSRHTSRSSLVASDSSFRSLHRFLDRYASFTDITRKTMLRGAETRRTRMPDAACEFAPPRSPSQSPNRSPERSPRASIDDLKEPSRTSGDVGFTFPPSLTSPLRGMHRSSTLRLVNSALGQHLLGAWKSVVEFTKTTDVGANHNPGKQAMRDDGIDEAKESMPSPQRQQAQHKRLHQAFSDAHISESVYNSVRQESDNSSSLLSTSTNAPRHRPSFAIAPMHCQTRSDRNVPSDERSKLGLMAMDDSTQHPSSDSATPLQSPASLRHVGGGFSAQVSASPPVQPQLSPVHVHVPPLSLPSMSAFDATAYDTCSNIPSLCLFSLDSKRGKHPPTSVSVSHGSPNPMRKQSHTASHSSQLRTDPSTLVTPIRSIHSSQHNVMPTTSARQRRTAATRATPFQAVARAQLQQQQQRQQPQSARSHRDLIIPLKSGSLARGVHAPDAPVIDRTVSMSVSGAATARAILSHDDPAMTDAWAQRDLDNRTLDVSTVMRRR